MSLSKNGRVREPILIEQTMYKDAFTPVQNEYVELIDWNYDFIKKITIRQTNTENAAKNIEIDMILTDNESNTILNMSQSFSATDNKTYFYRDQQFIGEPTDLDLFNYLAAGIGPVNIMCKHVYLRIRMTSALGTNQQITVSAIGGVIKRV